MDNRYDHIDELMRPLADMSEMPPEAVWTDLSDRLDKKERRSPFAWARFVLPLLFLVGSVSGYFWMKSSDKISDEHANASPIAATAKPAIISRAEISEARDKATDDQTPARPNVAVPETKNTTVSKRKQNKQVHPRKSVAEIAEQTNGATTSFPNSAHDREKDEAITRSSKSSHDLVQPDIANANGTTDAPASNNLPAAKIDKHALKNPRTEKSTASRQKAADTAGAPIKPPTEMEEPVTTELPRNEHISESKKQKKAVAGKQQAAAAAAPATSAKEETAALSKTKTSRTKKTAEAKPKPAPAALNSAISIAKTTPSKPAPTSARNTLNLAVPDRPDQEGILPTTSTTLVPPFKKRDPSLLPFVQAKRSAKLLSPATSIFAAAMPVPEARERKRYKSDKALKNAYIAETKLADAQAKQAELLLNPKPVAVPKVETMQSEQTLTPDDLTNKQRQWNFGLKAGAGTGLGANTANYFTGGAVVSRQISGRFSLSLSPAVNLSRTKFTYRKSAGNYYKIKESEATQYGFYLDSNSSVLNVGDYSYDHVFDSTETYVSAQRNFTEIVLPLRIHYQISGRFSVSAGLQYAFGRSLSLTENSSTKTYTVRDTLFRETPDTPGKIPQSAALQHNDSNNIANRVLPDLGNHMLQRFGFSVGVQYWAADRVRIDMQLSKSFSGYKTLPEGPLRSVFSLPYVQLSAEVFLRPRRRK